jgi:hypothetical protein
MAEPTAVEKLKAWVAENLQALQAANIETIVGEYSGSGDEGNWESISFEPAGSYEKLDEELRDEVTELMEQASEELENPGYETGDGGGGSLTLNVSTGKLLHSEYYYETVREYTTEDKVV